MAEMIPSHRGPGYGSQFADRMQAFDENAAARLQAELESRTKSLDSILGNITKIAEVSGSGALDPLANMYAGAQQPVFGTDYAKMSDSLRQSMMRAQIGSMNRSGRGGGGGDKPPKPLTGGGWYEFTYPSGEVVQRFIKDSEADSIPYHSEVQGVTFKPIAPPAQAPTGNDVYINRGAPQTAEKKVIKTFDDGSVLYEDGTTG